MRNITQVQTTRMINAVASDHVEHILWDGAKVKGIMGMMDHGVSQEQIVKMFGEKLYNRCFKLKDGIATGHAFILQKSPIELGMVFRVGESFKLTPKGESELDNIAHRDHEANVKRAMADEKVFKSFEPVARKLFLKNTQLWVIKYKRRLLNPDEGSLIYTAYLKGIKSSPIVAVNAVEKYLLMCLKKRYKDQLDADIQETLKNVAGFYPAKNPTQEEILAMFTDVSDKMDEIEIDAEVDIEQDLDEPSLDDDKLDSVRCESIGTYITASDPKGKLVGFILDLQVLRNRILAGEYSTSGQLKETIGLVKVYHEDEMFEEHIRPIIDHYTGQELLGSDLQFVTVNKTEFDKAQEREDFPYEPNIDKKSILRYNPCPKYIDYFKETVEYAFESIEIRRESELFDSSLFKPFKTTQQTAVRRHAGDRKIVKQQRRYNEWNGKIYTEDQFNHEIDADFQLNKSFEACEDWGQWRKNLIMAAIATPSGKTHINRVGYDKYVADMMAVMISVRLEKKLDEWKKKPVGKMPTAEAIWKSLEAKFMWNFKSNLTLMA